MAEFAAGMSGSHNYYAQYRCANTVKANLDQHVGKKGEYFVAYYLHTLGLPLLTPDMDIYDSKLKNWRADLEYDGLDVHVKSCSKMWGNDYSWVFNWSNTYGSGGKDKIFETESGLIACIYMENSESPTANLKAIIPWKNAKTMLKNPVVERLRGLKLCLYYKDLQSIKL